MSGRGGVGARSSALKSRPHGSVRTGPTRLAQWIVRGGWAIGLVALVACARDYAARPPVDIAAAVTARVGDDGTTSVYVGPLLSRKRYRAWLLGYDYAYYRLEGERQTSGILDHRLHVDLLYAGDWRGYQTAHIAPGPAQQAVVFVTRKYDSHISSLPDARGETFDVPLGHNLLLRHLVSGLVVSVSAASGHHNVLTVPPSYIQGYLAAATAADSSTGNGESRLPGVVFRPTPPGSVLGEFTICPGMAGRGAERCVNLLINRAKI